MFLNNPSRSSTAAKASSSAFEASGQLGHAASATRRKHRRASRNMIQRPGKIPRSPLRFFRQKGESQVVILTNSRNFAKQNDTSRFSLFQQRQMRISLQTSAAWPNKLTTRVARSQRLVKCQSPRTSFATFPSQINYP